MSWLVQFRARMLVGNVWTSFTPTSAKWPTLPLLHNVTTSHVTAASVDLTVVPSTLRALRLRCYTANVYRDPSTNMLIPLGFEPVATAALGEVQYDANAGYITVSQHVAGMRIQTAFGQPLQACSDYLFKCDVETPAGFSNSVHQSVRLLPNVPFKMRNPPVIQMDTKNKPYVDKFILVLEAPVDTLANGGVCSQYTFSVVVKLGAEILVNQSGMVAGNFEVNNLTEATTYSVTVQAANQAGIGQVSDVMQVTRTCFCCG